MAWQAWIGEIMAGLTFVVLASAISFVAYTAHYEDLERRAGKKSA